LHQGGYCFINNAAIAAQILSQSGKRVAVIDVDYHHGNGTQDIFYSRSDVFYVSLHGDPNRAYPYFSGSSTETGEGDGAGFTLNVPLPAGCDDAMYTSALKQAMIRVAQFQPDFVVVSLGIDTFMGDPLGDFCLSRDGYSSIGRIIGSLHVATMYLARFFFSSLSLSCTSYWCCFFLFQLPS
jgi:acetoin utilization deacetylase AcuC-like enzyme